MTKRPILVISPILPTKPCAPNGPSITVLILIFVSFWGKESPQVKKPFPMFLIVFFWVTLLSAAEPYKATPIQRFANKHVEDDYYFRKGRVLIDGGYQGQ